MIGNALRTVRVIAESFREIRIIAGVSKAAEFGEQRGIHHYVIKHLGAAIEYIRVLLVMRQSGDKISEIRINEVRAGGDHLVNWRGSTENGADHIDIAITEF